MARARALAPFGALALWAALALLCTRAGPSASLPLDTLLTTCPYAVGSAADAKKVAGAWFLVEALEAGGSETSLGPLPCLQYHFTPFGASLLAMRVSVLRAGAVRESRETNFTRSASGAWHGEGPAAGSFALAPAAAGGEGGEALCLCIADEGTDAATFAATLRRAPGGQPAPRRPGAGARLNATLPSQEDCTARP